MKLGSISIRRPGDLLNKATVSAGGNAVVLFFNLLAAVVLARAVSATGRGDFAAATTATPLIAWVVATGAQQSITYHLAGGRRRADELIAAWTTVALPLCLLGIAIGELVVHLTLREQSSHVQLLASLFVVAIVVFAPWEGVYGILVGSHRFLAYSSLRVAQAGLQLAAYVGLYAWHHLTVESAMAGFGASWAMTLVIGATLVARRHGIGRFDAGTAREGLWYGLKSHGYTTANLVTLRLDLVLLPAFVVNRELGWYAVASSVASVIPSIVLNGALVVVPSGAAAPDRRDLIVRRAAVLAGCVCAAACLALGLFAESALRVVYGAPFIAAAESLRVLLFGSVAFSVAGVFMNGLLAMDRPFLATVSQLPAGVFTVVALFIALPRGGGIEAAAVISAVSYAMTAMVAAALYEMSSRRLKRGASPMTAVGAAST